MCTSVPVCKPSTDTRPARRPCSMLRVTTYITEGPGITSSASAAMANTPRVEGAGTASCCQWTLRPARRLPGVGLGCRSARAGEDLVEPSEHLGVELDVDR